jgi:hypothetical protein
MSVLSKTALLAQAAANITTNGTESNTGAGTRTVVQNIIDSYQDAIPQLTTAQINALTPTLNQLVFNTDRNYMMQYNGTIWVYLVAMFIGDTAAIAGSTPKEGQLFYNTTTSTLSFGDGVTHLGVQTTDACTCVQTVKVSISSAEILNSFTTPIELIAAPGAGKMIQVLSFACNFTYNGITYATNTTAQLLQGSTLVRTFNLNFAASGQIYAAPSAPPLLVSSSLENENISFSTQTGNPTAGDGTFDIHITYTVITL